MTKEERQQVNRERREEKERMRREFPVAHLEIDGELKLVLPEGNDADLLVLKRGPWEKLKDGEKWHERSLYLWGGNIWQLAQFIRALIARYNAQVEWINRDASARMKPLAIFEAEGKKDGEGAASPDQR